MIKRQITMVQAILEDLSIGDIVYVINDASDFERWTVGKVYMENGSVTVGLRRGPYRWSATKVPGDFNDLWIERGVQND